MPPIIETGHAKNVGNFEILNSACIGFGVIYNPSKNSIKLVALATLLSDSKHSLIFVNSLIPAWQNAVNAREIVFAPLGSLVTRVVNALIASDVTKQVIADAKSVAKKIQGRRSSKKMVDDPNTPEDESLQSISASQVSFDQRINNFDLLIQILSSQPNYTPNEVDLQVVSLTTLLADLRTKNTATINAYTPLRNARIARDKVLYDTGTGLVDIAGEVKSYVKSVFGASSQEYKSISGLKFKKVKS